MLKKIFNFRNLIFLVIMIALVVVIVKQQSTLNDKVEQYKAAVAESEEIAGEREDFENGKAIGNKYTSDEDRARGAGYVYNGEIVFIYG